MHYNFIEIGTSDFDTLIQSTSNQIGLSIDPIQLYLDRLPNNPYVIKVNAAISFKDGFTNAFWVNPEDITKYNLSWYLKGCNSIYEPHPLTLKEIQDKNLEHLMNKIKVEILTWKTLVKRYNIEIVDFLKIDAEGHDTIIVNDILDNNSGVLPKKIQFEANALTSEEDRNETLKKAQQCGYNFNYWAEMGEVILTFYDCDYIINTAAETHVGNSIVRSDDFLHSNVNGVHHLLELIRNFRQEGKDQPILIHFSTDEVYGDIKNGAHTETDILKPSNPYSATKAAADMLILAWARTYNLPYIIVRPTNNYGIGQYVEKLIPKSVKYLSLGRNIPLHNGGTPIRNWLHADDTADAVIVIIDSNKTNEIYNICGGYEQSNIETFSKILSCYNGKTQASDYINLSFNREGQDVRYALDDSKLRTLGWFPKKDFNSELPMIVKYYENNFIW
jgi:dTDP-glucose 4,6-dehydratase